MNFKPNDKEEKPTNNKPEKVRANAVSPQNTSKHKGKNIKHKKLSRTKLNTLRAKGKHFNC